MIKNSKDLTSTEMSDAADYFASLVPGRWVHVVEAQTAPLTHVSAWALLPTAAETGPIGDRIIEVPVDPLLFEARDARAGFVAYVPPGSIARGEDLVRRGSEGGVPCGTCHGADLRGVGPIPGIAGRSPTYLVRQLYEFQHGIRAGSWSALMVTQVKSLSNDDMISIAAFAASLEP
jgi:cytochrome c553